MAATDARPVPIRNTAFRLTAPLLDADGDLVTGATGLDSEVSIDGGAFADATAEATEIATASGMYFLDLTAAEMNGDTIAVIVKTTTPGAKTSPLVFYPQESGDIKVDLQSWLGTAAATPTVAGVPEVDLTHWLGTAAATPTVAGVPEVDVTHFNGVAGTFAAGRPEVNASHVGGTLQTAGDIIGDTNDIQLRLPASLTGSGRMRSEVESYAAGMTPIRPSATGTADSGSTTTVVDTERTEADVDYWKGCLIKFTSGTLLGQTRLITAFDPALDTITFAPALTIAAGTHTYEILPMGRVDLHFWLGALVNALIAGRLDANMQALANAVITSLAFAANALDSAAIAAGAIGSSEFSAAAAQAIADEILNRDIAGGASGGTRNVRNALRALRNRVAEAAGTLTVYQEDDLAAAWTAAVTRNPAADPITQVDPV